MPQQSPAKHLDHDMADKMSSSSTSSSGNTYSPLSRGSAGSDELCLVIRQQPPTYLYSNESFDVEIALDTPKGASPSSFDTCDRIGLDAQLYNVKTGQLCGNEAILITEPSDIVLEAGSSGTAQKICKVKCMIRMDVIRREQGATLKLRFAPSQDSGQGMPNLSVVSTQATHLVNYKIKISLDDDWEKVWYKDEGGRDKSMEVYASIQDKDGQIRTGEQITIFPVLCYASKGPSGPKVSNQEILRILGSPKIVIDKDSGKARVRFRVEDVSKNHQGQDFTLKLGTDAKAKGFKDVAPAYTPSVNIRSKRNKRSRKESFPSDRADKILSPNSRARLSYDDRDVAFEAADVGKLRDSIKGVINWTEEVINGLYPLQWQVLGYGQHPDGSPDYSRPYHNMPNPNQVINRVLSLYSDSVRDYLRVIVNAIDQPIPPQERNPRPYYPPTYDLRNPPPPVHATAVMPPRLPPPLPQSLRASEFPPRDFSRRPQIPATGGFFQPQPPYRPSRLMRSEETGVIIEPEESREEEVHYVLARQYKSLRTQERLGFPAYSINKELLGFYKEANNKVGVRQFSPISRHGKDFGPNEIMQAKEILEDAIAKKSDAVHSREDWGTLSTLLDNALVYDWSKDIDHDPAGAQNPR